MEGAIPPVSTGVGLANIRNRLAQAYGENHFFETRSEPGGGFTVTIEIPFITQDAAMGATGAIEAQADTLRAPNNPAGSSSGSSPQTETVINLNPQRAIGSKA